MGISSVHNENVMLVLNPETGISQYHMVFDNTFSTVATTIGDLQQLQQQQRTGL